MVPSRPSCRRWRLNRAAFAELIDILRTSAPRRTHPEEPARQLGFAIDHLGIAVRSIDASLPFYQLLGLGSGHRETVPHEKVNVAMLPAGESRIELLEATAADSAIAKFHREARRGFASRGAARSRSGARGRRACRKRACACLTNRAAGRADTSMSSSIHRAPVAYYGNLFKTKERVKVDEREGENRNHRRQRLVCNAGVHGHMKRSKSRRRSATLRIITSWARWAAKRLRFWRGMDAGTALSPSELNFRANIYGMKKLGVERILSLSAVGSLKEEHRPLDFVIPDQFSIARADASPTFFGDGLVAHVSFADPVCPNWRWRRRARALRWA